jgi:hypothetical protein
LAAPVGAVGFGSPSKLRLRRRLAVMRAAMEARVESATFRKWLADRGCRFEAGKDSVETDGHVYVTVHRENRRAVLPEVGTKKALDPRVVRQIVDDLGLDWNQLPGPTSRV